MFFFSQKSEKKKRVAKDKGEKERYTHWNAEFQRITRRDKKAFLSDRYKEIEENNRMGKTSDLFKKIRDFMQSYHKIVLISHASKVMLKILQARLQQYMNRELPDVQATFRKGRGTRGQIATICWIPEKAREFQKKNLLLLY